MSDYICSKELREFEKQFNHIVSVTHHDAITVFDDLLTFIIFNFNPNPKPNPYWKYNQEQNQLFFQLMREWLYVLQRMIDARGWYDAFGDFFMSNVGRTSQQYKGQFFTPHTICDFMAKVVLDDRDETTEPRVTCNAFGKRVVANDSACGSARMLLAAHATNCERGHRAYYFIGEDIDRICCKMAAVNMCAHGMFGEVVCHDTLCEPHKAFTGYIINEGLYPFPGCPTSRITDEPMQFISCRAAMGWMAEATKRTETVKVPEEVKAEAPKEQKAKVPEQLTLNFFE